MRVLSISESAWLNTATSAVWRLVLPVEEWPRWNESISEARWLGARGWKEGNRFRFSYTAPGGRLLSGGVISRVDAQRELRWTGRILALRVEFALQVIPEGSGVRVVFASHFRGISARIAAGDVIARRIGTLQRDFLQSLRIAGEHVEGKVR